MNPRIGVFLLVLAALSGPARAQSHPRESCVDQLHRNSDDLPAASRAARATLIANPGRIGTVAARAARAPARERAEIELGVLRAAEWLKCVDPYGYRALDDYMRANPNDPVAADLNRALNAQASLSSPTEAAPASGASQAGASAAGAPAFSAPSFAIAGPVVSPSH